MQIIRQALEDIFFKTMFQIFITDLQHLHQYIKSGINIIYFIPSTFILYDLDLTEISVKYLYAVCISVLLQLFYFTPNDCIDLPSGNSVVCYWVHRSTK